MMNLNPSEPFFSIEEIQNGLKNKGIELGDKLKVLSTMPNDEKIIDKSIEIMSLSSSKIYSQIKVVTNEVLIHMSQSSNSYVSEKAMGSIFLYPKESPTICYFIEELAHQGGHLILLAATDSPLEYFKCEQEAYNQNHHSKKENNRTNYVVLHSIFTLGMIATCFKDVLNSNLLNKRQNFEALGRLIYASKRFELDTINILNSNTLNTNGLILLKRLSNSVNLAVSQYKEKGMKLNMKGHEYDFSTINFMNRNSELINE